MCCLANLILCNMKKKSLFIVSIAIIASILEFTGCKSLPPKPEEVEIIVPCSGSDFRTTGDLIRANGIGESMDQQMAIRIARSAALEDLSQRIRVSIGNVVNDYYKSINQNTSEDFTRRFEGLTELVSKETVFNYRTICEKMTRNTKNRNYKSYIAIEVGVDETVKHIHRKLTEAELLKIDIDYEKFREKFSIEMQKQ